jgi:hypothetical protein
VTKDGTKKAVMPGINNIIVIDRMQAEMKECGRHQSERDNTG